MIKIFAKQTRQGTNFKRMKKIVLLFSLLVCFKVTNAQTLEKFRESISVWSYLQGQYYSPNENFRFIADVQLRYSSEELYTELSSSIPFYRGQYTLGGEYYMQKGWLLGASARVADERTTNIIVPKGWIAHRGEFLGLSFYKEVGIESFNYFETIGNTPDYYRWSLLVSLAKELSLGDKLLTLHMDYRIFRNQGEARASQSRRIDKTRWFLGAKYPLTEKLDLEIFLMKETNYLKLIATQGRFDAEGNQIEPPKPERNYNKVTPILGFGLSYAIKKSSKTTNPSSLFYGY